MCRVKANIEEGLIPTERVARISTIEGFTEEFTVSSRQVQDNTVVATCVERHNGNVLLELPRESASGKWRVWVSSDNVEGIE